MDCSMPGFPVLHYLPEFAQIHVHWVSVTISSSASSFSFCLQFFPTSASFTMSQILTPGGPSIGASASATVLPMNIQEWVPLGLIVLISLLSKGLSRDFSSTTIWKHQFLDELSHQYITIGKTITLTIQTFVGKVMSLLYNMLSRFVLVFLSRSQWLLI